LDDTKSPLVYHFYRDAVCRNTDRLPKPGNRSKFCSLCKNGYSQSSLVVLATFYDEIKGFGTIRATNALDLEAKFDGIVHFNNLKGRIKKGAVLYTMGGPEIELKKENLKKALANAQTQYTYFKQYYAAKKLLVEKDYLSRIDFEKVVRDFDNAQNNLNKAQYELDYFLAMTRYKAPFDGYLDYIQVPQGEDAVVGQLLGDSFSGLFRMMTISN